MRLLTLVLVLFSFGVDALAELGRPVSDLRFDGLMPHHSARSIDSDGAGFLARSSPWLQKVENGRPIGPVNPIFDIHDHVWTGTHHLLVNHRFTAQASREGSLISEPVEVFPTTGDARVVTNGTTALIFQRGGAGRLVRPVNLAGHPTGPAVPLPPVTYTAIEPAQPDLAAAGNRFAAVLPSNSGTVLFIVRPDGSVEHTVNLPVPAGHQDRVHDTHVASDGTDFLVVYQATRISGGMTLVTAVVGVDGTIRRTTQIDNSAAFPYHSVSVAGLVWTGSQYIALADLTTTVGQNPVPVVLLRMTREGEISGPPVTLPGHVRAWDLAWSGSELAVVTDSGVSSIDAAMRVTPPVQIGQWLSTQEGLSVTAGPGGYLAVWEEDVIELSTIRASRIDAGGNYLDGDGIVVDAAGSTMIQIDGNGPHWLLAWRDPNGTIWTRRLSFAGILGPPAVAVGTGFVYDVMWNGSHYVLLREQNDDFHVDTLGPDGTLLSTRVVVAATSVGELPNETVTYPENGRLLKLNDRVLLVYGAFAGTCGVSWFCAGRTTVMALPLDPPTATPFVIDDRFFSAAVQDVATDGSRGLVLYADSTGGVWGVFLNGTSAETRFQLRSDWSTGRVAHDANGFLAIVKDYGEAGQVFRIQPNGSFTGAGTSPDPWVDLNGVAASTTLQPLFAFDDRRAELLLLSDFTPNGVPAAPRITCVTENNDGSINVYWEAVTGANGISIELQLPDGTFRQIGVARSNGMTQRVSRWGLRGNAIRLRAWNAAGYSSPSATSSTSSGPQASLRSAIRACSGKPVTIAYSLSGVAPFTVRWSDGLVQTNLTANASRTATVNRDTTLSIVSVNHHGCGSDETVRSVRILVDPAAVIEEQPREVKIARGETATLTIEADHDLDFAWFEGNRGDMTRPVGTNSPEFTTPALQTTTRYWVRVSNRCGSTDSDAIVVVVTGGKGRAVRK